MKNDPNDKTPVKKADSGDPGGIENQNPVAHLPADDPAAMVSDITETISKNVSVAEKVSKPGPAKTDSAGWKGEPVSNFKTDADGKIVMRNGKPVRRGGRPRKRAKAGERMADGSAAGIGGADSPSPSPAVPSGNVVLPSDGPPVPDASGTAEVQAGPEAGSVLAKLGFNVAQRKGGDKWKPDDDERELIEKAASASLDGRRLPWPVVLVVGVLAYVLARIEFKKKEKPDDGDDTPVHHRPDAERKDAASPTTGKVGPFAWG